jgi:hypothetical protein
LWSLVAGQHLFETGQVHMRSAAWRAKRQATFSDIIASVRRWLWRHEYFSLSPDQPDTIKFRALWWIALLCNLNG